MSEITLPYNLQDGQKAYASRVMANFRALIAGLNRVSVDGLTAGDLESVLRQLKLLVDELGEDRNRGVASLTYDGAGCKLVLTLADGARYQVDMGPFINQYQGVTGDTVSVTVDGQGHIAADLQPGGVGESQLAAAVKDKIDGKITAGASGNAAQVKFSDGQSFQDKLDAGQLKGADGVAAAISGMYYFRYDATDGHLYVGTASGAGQPPLAIDNSGHLIYTIE